jgi:DNA-binding transcriptional LysR family regulator
MKSYAIRFQLRDVNNDNLEIIISLSGRIHGPLRRAADLRRHPRRRQPGRRRAPSAALAAGSHARARSTGRTGGPAPDRAHHAPAGRDRRRRCGWPTPRAGCSPTTNTRSAKKKAARLRGKLRMTAPHVFGRRHVTPAIIAFLDLHPALQVEMVFNDRNVDLIDHASTWRCASAPCPTPAWWRAASARCGACWWPAPTTWRGAARPPRWRTSNGTTSFSTPASGRNTEWRFLHQGRELVVRLNPRLSINEIDAILMAVVAGRGIGRPLSYQVAEQLADGHTGAHLAALANRRRSRCTCWSTARAACRRACAPASIIWRCSCRRWP